MVSMDKKIITVICILSLSSTALARDITIPELETAQAIAAEEQSTSSRLKAILVVGKTKKALIDGIWFRQGQKIGSVHVILITKKSVKLEDNGVVVELSL